MTFQQILGVITAMAVASVVQSLSGFGFALLAVPLMSLVIEVRQAVVVSTVIAMGTTVVHAWNEREEADRRLALRLTMASFVGMPFGLLAFVLVPQSALKVALGVVVIVITLLLVRGVALGPESTGHEWAMGIVSGALATSLSTNGPPLVFLLQARGMSPEGFRGTISRIFAVVNIVTLVMFLASGRIARESLVVCAWAVPAVLVFTWFGYLLRPHLDAARFRVLVLVLLTLSGASVIVTALFG